MQIPLSTFTHHTPSPTALQSYIIMVFLQLIDPLLQEKHLANNQKETNNINIYLYIDVLTQY